MTPPTLPPLLRQAQAVDLLRSLGIRGGKRRLAELVAAGRVAITRLGDNRRAYYHTATIQSLEPARRP